MTGNKTPSIVTQHRENTIINFKLSMKKYFLTLGLLLMGILTTSAQTVGNPFVKENEEDKEEISAEGHTNGSLIPLCSMATLPLHGQRKPLHSPRNN